MKQHSVPAERNRDAILAVLKRVLPESGLVLEVGSGTGQHAVHFAAGLPGITWQPSDAAPEACASVSAWAAEAKLANLRSPLVIDVTKPWPVDHADAVVSSNLVHISPWETTLALFEGAAKVLSPDAPLVLYGPYLLPGQPTAPSNLEFDKWLRQQDRRWGLRDLGEVVAAAKARGFSWEETVPMPTNNVCVVLRRMD